MNWQDRIHFDPGLLGGKPIVNGTILGRFKTCRTHGIRSVTTNRGV